jgi:TRAP-type C4-dicarboxylate transport system substrate-binding protein
MCRRKCRSAPSPSCRGQTKSSCEATRAFYELARPGGRLDKLEFEPNGVRVVYAVVLSPYRAIFSKRADVKDLAGFAGKKMRSNPGPMESSIKAAGGTPVRMTPPEIFDAITKGTIDGALLPYTSTVAHGLDQVIGSATRGANFGSVGITDLPPSFSSTRS